ncbi:YggS family pyridoxal phosphate-dependent enzyme [Methylonatrum kenyense]|uniref:YggS family pyridoxal phosphate-dependent enzyme n=1 Tax=Methylonatrum kenyense TaxID=455253 RepID=UPI0020BEA623|nr:YggS family pyridoxal phosphate-dependent enzyme [Methylonatrum kenyense]MCK8516648.1 YggS family pyridoxal phosphate-dependent enzyme [Methylonatrum kenyense]
MPSIATRIETVRRRIREAEIAADRGPGSVTLLAVSKMQSVEALRQAVAAGQREFGENYLQEAADKQDQLADLAGLHWHFIGPLQSNKTKAAAARFDWVHSVDRLKLARRLDAQRPDGLPPLNICLQVNISDESSKAGLSPADTLALAGEIGQFERLRLRGLMAIPAPTDDPEEQRQPFRALRELRDRLNRRWGLQLDTLSMGMSADLEVAIAEGATIVRVGTDVFGPRPSPAAKP